MNANNWRLLKGLLCCCFQAVVVLLRLLEASLMMLLLFQLFARGLLFQAQPACSGRQLR